MKKAEHNKDKDRHPSRKKENNKDIKDGKTEAKDVKDIKDVKDSAKNHHHSRSRDKDRQKRSKSKEKHHNKYRSERTDKSAGDSDRKKEVKEEAKEDAKEIKQIKEADPLLKKKDEEKVSPGDMKTKPEPMLVEEKCDSNSAVDSVEGAVQSSQCSLDVKTVSSNGTKKEVNTNKPTSNQPKQEPTSTVSIRYERKRRKSQTWIDVDDV